MIENVYKCNDFFKEMKWKLQVCKNSYKNN